MTYLDDDGQPIIQGFNAYSNIRKATEHLLGICQGLIGDGQLTPQEVIFLNTWLANHQDNLAEWPGNIIVARVREVMSDRVISTEECLDLMTTLQALLGGGLEQDAGAGGLSTVLPVDPIAGMAIPGSLYCFTGKFIYGTRSRCAQAVIARGGQVATNVSQKLDYLVIGQLASRDWAQSSYGTKIEAVMGWKQAGHPIKIIMEATWSRYLA